MDMHKEIIQRLREFMFKKGMNQDDLAERLKMSRSTFSQQLNKTQRLALDMVVGPLAAFSKLSPDWLMFGKGEMERAEPCKSAAVSIRSTGIVSGGVTGLISQVAADGGPGEVEALRAKVREQERQISMLMEMLHEATVGKGRP